MAGIAVIAGDARPGVRMHVTEETKHLNHRYHNQE